MIVNKKLLFNIILTAAFALILLSGFIIFCSKSIIHNVLLNKSKEELVLIRDLKKQQLEKFFSDLKKHIELLTKDQTIQTGMQEFKTAFDQLVQTNNQDPNKQNYINLSIAQHYNNILKQYKEHSETKDRIDFSVFLQNLNYPSIMLQTKYMTNQDHAPIDIGSYADIHDKYHAVFQKIIDEYKYHDLLLLDLNGNIIYSTKKNIDFASSIISGAFSNTELANIFNTTKYSTPNEDQVIISNFSEYLPDYKEPILFAASKIQNFGVLITSIGLSSINSLVNLPDKTNETNLYLIDQDLHLITNNNFGASINTIAAREAAHGKKGFVEGLNKHKKMALSYFSPIENTNLSLIAEKNKETILQDISKSIINMLLFTGIVIPILLFFIYTIYCLCIEKVDNKLNKLSTFMQFVLTKKDLNSRINLNNTDTSGIADILNNMLSWFQNTLDQVAFKIKQFINKYNNLFNNITDLSAAIQTKQPLLESAKISTENLVKNQEQLQYNLEQHFSNINNHKESCLALSNLYSEFNNLQKSNNNIANLTSSVEYILNICNLSDMLTLHLSLEASKISSKQDNNFLLLSKEIKKMVANLKSKLMQIKDSFDSYIIEHDHIKNFVTEFSEKLKPITSNLESLLDNQKPLLTSSSNAQNIINNLQNNLLELENKYQAITQQLSTLLAHNNQLNIELKADDYYPFKIVENTTN
jgi:methyl-accepting chemotaxis protein